jgi:hypothetical protein
MIASDILDEDFEFTRLQSDSLATAAASQMMVVRRELIGEFYLILPAGIEPLDNSQLLK